MKLYFIFYFIQTDAQATEGLWIMGFLILALIFIAIWTNLQPDEKEKASYTLPGAFTPYEKEKRLKSYLDTPWLIYEGMIIDVKKTNPSLAATAESKVKEYKIAKSQKEDEKLIQKLLQNPITIPDSLINKVRKFNPTLAESVIVAKEEALITHRLRNATLLDDVAERNFKKGFPNKERLLSSYLDYPWLIDENLIKEVKKINPKLSLLAEEKLKVYNNKSNNESLDKISEITDDEGNIMVQVSTDEDNLQKTMELLEKKYEDEGYEIKIEVIHEKKKRSRRLTQDVKDKVWRRDEGKCVECGSNENLEFDHIIPHSKGGANTYRNIQLLCEKCNRSKSDKIG